MADAGIYSASGWMPRYNPWVTALTVTLATFMEVLDTSIANVAHRRRPQCGTGRIHWVLTSYLVSNAIVLPMSGWLTTVIGRKRFYMLIFFRILQGTGGGAWAPVSKQFLPIPSSLTSGALRSPFMGGMAVVVAPAIGPTLGGWITDNYDWRWIFFINVPVGRLSLFLTSQVVEDQLWLRGH